MKDLLLSAWEVPYAGRPSRQKNPAWSFKAWGTQLAAGVQRLRLQSADKVFVRWSQGSKSLKSAQRRRPWSLLAVGLQRQTLEMHRSFPRELRVLGHLKTRRCA